MAAGAVAGAAAGDDDGAVDGTGRSSNRGRSRRIGWNGDALEAQAFGFLAVRALRGLPISFPGTTGAPRPLTGGRVDVP